jgi:lysophospholipid acyltransferase (LPLAT)-like uncharacterized protein
MLKALGKNIVVLKGLGLILAGYLRLVRVTSRVTYDPPDMPERLRKNAPLVAGHQHPQRGRIQDQRAHQHPRRGQHRGAAIPRCWQFAP